MCFLRKLFLVIFIIIPLQTLSLLVHPNPEKDLNSSQSQASIPAISGSSFSEKNVVDDDLSLNNAQESSANFFTSDLGAPFDSSSDYGTLFDHFPSLPYFPEFGEIFRISRTTTPEPPFSFPDYLRDSFSQNPGEKPMPTSEGDTSSKYTETVGGGRRPGRRPPRPASSGTRTKITKQNQSDQREKPKVIKSKPPMKSRDYPKIFRFTSDRVNLADFDMKKKMNENYLTLAKGDELDSDKVKRSKFLILHGGVFEIDRNGRHGLYPSNSDVKADVTSPDDTFTYER